nr:ribonuclease H-like domain-containing protein [Tanacetum cinerariifolium]
PVPTVVPQSIVKSPRPVKHVVNKEHSPLKRPINYRPTTKNSNFIKKVTTVKPRSILEPSLPNLIITLHSSSLPGFMLRVSSEGRAGEGVAILARKGVKVTVNVVPTAVLTRLRLVSLNAARPVPTVVPQSTVKSPRPVKHVVNKAHSPISRPIDQRTTTKNSKKVTIVKVNDVQDTKGNAKKALANWGNPQQAQKDKGVIDSGCSRHMTRNISFLSDFEKINRGYVALRGNPKGGKILGKCKIKTGKLDFDDVYFVKEIKFNLFSVSQMCDKKKSVLFTDTECVVLSSDYKLPDENHVLLKVLRENNMYNVDLQNVVPSGDLTCLFANATLDKSNLWHRRLGHIIFNTMIKLVKGNLVRGLPSKIFDNNHTCVACQKGKQHRASWIRPKWLFDIDTLTKSMNYQPDVTRNQPNDNADPQNTDDDDAFDLKENKPDVHVSVNESDKSDSKKHDEKAKRDDKGKTLVDSPIGVRYLRAKFEEFSSNSTNRVNAVSAAITAAGLNSTNITNSFNTASPSDTAVSPNFGIAEKSSFVDPFKYPDDPDMIELEDVVYSDDEKDVAPQTRSMTRMVKEQGGLHQTYDEDFHTYMFACFLSQEEPNKVNQALKDASWIEAMQEELLQFKMKKVWVLVDLPKGKRAIGFKDPDYPDKVYKVVKALYGLHQASRAWYETLANYLLENDFQRGKIDQTLSTNKETCKAFEKLMKDKFQRSSIGELTFFLGLQVKQKDAGIFISQDKYVAKILRKFGFTDVKSASTPIETEKPLLKEPDGEDVDVHIYRKSTTGGCQFLGCRLISWQCKKQTVVATSSTKAEYVAAASCCAQVLLIQNQLLDYRARKAV